MKKFDKSIALIIVIIILAFIIINVYMEQSIGNSENRTYRVEIGRIADEIETTGIDNVDFSKYKYIKNVVCYDETQNKETFFAETNDDYMVKTVNDRLYRFDYITDNVEDNKYIVYMVNIIYVAMAFFVIAILAFIRWKVLKPFNVLSNVPYELAKGNLTVPVKENKNRFFGRFVWGVDMLRESMESQKKKELDLQREKKMLVLSVSHDIKTPLSAIKLYAKAISKGLYADKDKQIEIADNINAKADEIESFVSQIIKASNEEFLSLEVTKGEFYLSELIGKISIYYREKLKLINTEFGVEEYSDCMIEGDIDRSIEVIQNIIENAIKYGDGHIIAIEFSEEDGCQLITVKNSGCTLPDSEITHIFESFYRGSNTGSNAGSGLGLYICRKLMNMMSGEIFAEKSDDFMRITTVFKKS